MTNEFKKYGDLLAKGLNFPENALVFSVGIDNGAGNLDVTTTFSGDSINVDSLIRIVLEIAIKQTLKHMGTDVAKAQVEMFKECLDNALNVKSEAEE